MLATARCYRSGRILHDPVVNSSGWLCRERTDGAAADARLEGRYRALSRRYAPVAEAPDLLRATGAQLDLAAPSVLTPLSTRSRSGEVAKISISGLGAAAQFNTSFTGPALDQ